MRECPIEVHVWTDITPFSVMIYIDDERQKPLIERMESYHRLHHFSAAALCRLCILYRVRFKIVKNE